MAFSRIQGTGSARVSNGHSLGVTLTGVTAGNLLVAIGNSAPSTTIADSQGNTWQTAVASGRVTIWYAVVTTGGTVTVTATSSQANYIDLSVEEWSYLGLIGVDSTGTGTGTGTSPATSNLTLARTDLVVAGFDVATPSLTYTAGSGFALGYTTDAAIVGEPFATEYNAAQSATPIAPGLTLSSSSAWTGAAAAFVERTAATLIKTEAHDSLVATAAFTAGGTASKTEAHDSLALTGNAIDAATLAVTGGDDGLAGAAIFRSTAAVARAEGADSLAAAGDSPRTASLAATEDHDGLATSCWCIVASISRTEAHDALAASGDGSAVATIARTESHDALVGFAVDTASGAIARTSTSDSLAGSGDAAIHGSIAAAGSSDTLVAAADTGKFGVFGATGGSDAMAAPARFTSSAVLSVATPGDDRLFTGSILEYHVYANGGSGAIDYDTPVATTGLLTWTSPVLACGSDWRFGVRCFDPGSGLEEKNLDCSVEIILDTGCADVTNRPAAPFGLRAFATAGGGVKVEWHFPLTTGPRKPAGFHVYIGTPAVSYAGSVATVLYSAGFANTFQATLAGLTDGVVYAVGVRAYNTSAEELNVNVVSVTADSTGPSPVVGLTGTAIV